MTNLHFKAVSFSYSPCSARRFADEINLRYARNNIHEMNHNLNVRRSC